MNAPELAAEIAKRYPCVQGRYAYRCQTGEPYVIFAERGGPDDEGECCARMLKAFERYAKEWWRKHGGSKPPTLYWRYAEPHVHWYADDDNKRRMFAAALYCRLVLSNLPIVNETEAEYDTKRTAELKQEIIDGRQRQPPEPTDQEQRKAATTAARQDGAR